MFLKCGILSTTFSVASCTGVTEDLFAVLEEDPIEGELSSFMNELSNGTCSQEEYVTGNDLPVCDEASDEWDERFMTELQSTMNEDHVDIQDDDDGDEGSFDLQPPPLKHCTYQEAMFALAAF